MLEFLRRQLMKYPPKSPNDLLEFNDTHIRNAVYSRAPRLYSRGGEHRAYKLGSVPRQGRGLGVSRPRSSAAMDSASYPEDSPRDAYTTHGGVTASYSGKRQTGFVKAGIFRIVLTARCALARILCLPHGAPVVITVS